MPDNVFVIDVPEIPLSLLKVEGIFSPLKHRLIIISLSFLLIIIIIGSGFIVYFLFTDGDAFVEKYIVMFIFIVALFFCPIYLVNMLAQRKKIPFMKITEKGIEYSEENIIGSQISNYISWKWLAPCLITLEYHLGSETPVPPNLKFYINSQNSQLKPITICITSFKRFTNSKELITAFLLNLINLDKGITFAENLFYELNLDPENILELFVKRPAKKTQYYKRTIVNVIFAMAVICIVLLSIIWIVSLDLSALVSTLLTVLMTFLIMISTSILTTIMITKYTHIEPPYDRILYRIKK